MNKITKRDIIEAITFILMTVGIITMIVTLYQLKELHNSIKEIHSITIRK